MKKSVLIFILLAVFALLTACSDDGQVLDASSPENAMLENVQAVYKSGEAVTISFDHEKQSGWASNQFAVWIEDLDGGFIRTLYATRFTANGGYKNRPESLSEWVTRSGLAEMEKAQLDAITSATPGSGRQNLVWDLTDSDGELMPAGQYRFFVEGNLRWSNRVLFSGIIEIGGEAATSEATAEYFYAS